LAVFLEMSEFTQEISQKWCRRSDSTAFSSRSDVHSVSRNSATFNQPLSSYITSTERTARTQNGSNLAVILKEFTKLEKAMRMIREHFAGAAPDNVVEGKFKTAS
jgi:hypothetical protein